MSSPLASYGANLAILALTEAKAAGDKLLQSISGGVATEIPMVTQTAITDLIDVIPASYRGAIHAMFDAPIAAAETAIDTVAVDRIHTGLAIAQAVLDTRIVALQAMLTAPTAGTALVSAQVGIGTAPPLP